MRERKSERERVKENERQTGERERYRESERERKTNGRKRERSGHWTFSDNNSVS
jgi:hypothetical protein